MKKLVAVMVAVGVLSLGAVAFAHWGGGSGYYGGPMMGWGGGPGMMWGYFGGDEDSGKFLDETVDIRKQLNDKRFEYGEAYRAGDEEKLKALDAEIEKLGEKLNEKAGQRARGFGGRGGVARGGYGYGPGACGGPYWR